MRKINDCVYVIRQKDLNIIRLKVVKITITENNISYSYGWADNETHFSSVWATEWLRNNGKMLIFDTEKQAKEHIKGANKNG